MSVAAVTDRLVAVWRFVERYTTMAGRSCCVGRSWVSLERSLERRCSVEERRPRAG